jgi:hypothetical protein
MPAGHNSVKRVLAPVALGVATLVVTAPPGGASPVPSLFQNPTFCTPPPLPIFSPGCHTAIEPKQWVFTGDGSGFLYELHWTKWGAEEADGTGVLFAQTGVPSRGRCGCTRLPVWVLADYAVEYRGHYVYAIVSTGPRPPSEDQRAYQTITDL